MRNIVRLFARTIVRPDRHRLSVAVVLLLLIGRSAWAQATNDPLERSLYFVDKSTEATELFNTQHTQEALAIFQELARSYADLDEDGYVSLSVGDCFAAMGKYEQARQAYAELLAKRSDLQLKVQDRLLEAELLSGTVSPETVAKLRQAVTNPAPGEDSYRNRVKLGLALERQAYALLAEAVEVFRSAAPAGWFKQVTDTNRHMLVLDELRQDLATVLNQSNAMYGLRALPPCKTDAVQPKSEIQTDRRRAEYILRAADGKQFEVIVRPGEAPGHEEILVNGKALDLTEDEQQIIDRHQDRINAILLQAANRGH